MEPRFFPAGRLLEELMRYLLILLPLAVAGCAYSYPVEYGYNYPAAGYGYYGPTTTPGYGYGSAYNTAQATDTENCGTPYVFKACPPMPRRPLAYYPANRS